MASLCDRRAEKLRSLSVIRRRGTCRWFFSNLRKNRTAACRFRRGLHEDVTGLIHGAPQVLLATLERDEQLV